jgi:hypothetical protein
MDKRTCLKPSNNECFTWTQKNVCQVESSNFERTNKKNVSTEWRWALRCMCTWVTLTWCLARPNGAFNWSNTWQSDFSAAYQLCICILVWRLYAYIAMHWLINLILPLIYSICLFTCHRSMYLINIYPSIHLSIYLSVRPSVCLSITLYQFIRLSCMSPLQYVHTFCVGFCILSHFHQLAISTMISSPSACTVIVHESKGTSHDTSGNTDAMFGSGNG